MVPSGAITVELSISGVFTTACSGGRNCGDVRSIERSSRNCFGPACGLRPVCCGSIWYIGLPPAVAGTGERAAPTTVPRDGDAAGEAAGLMAGLTVETGAGRALAGELAGGCVGFAAVAAVGWGSDPV